jgi:hypothetical protein
MLTQIRATLANLAKVNDTLTSFAFAIIASGGSGPSHLTIAFCSAPSHLMITPFVSFFP